MPKYGPHEFHIPVMGTGFTIDTPVKVAKYGISSVISIVDDVLVEMMRKYYSDLFQRPYEEISEDIEDFRGLRIEKYLNLIHDIVAEDFVQLKKMEFTSDSDLTRFFRLLPASELKTQYEKMLATSDQVLKLKLQNELRGQMKPGTIDVNIMTKLDRDIYKGKEILPHKFADAMSALRGYANSALNSCIIFSAGLNQKLYSYIAEFPDFFPDGSGQIKKRVVLKVSDYH